MTFEQAAQRQHLHSSFYTVFLVGPNGERERIGTSQRKSGVGLRTVLYRESVQARIKQFPDADSLGMRQQNGGLNFTNGWRIEFGGTIRQEASAS